MKFEKGQKYSSKNIVGRVAEVIEVKGGGSEAWVEMRDKDGRLLDSANIDYAQFSGHWTLLSL